MAVARKVKARKTKENSPSKSEVEEVLAHGDSINITAARVSDKPGRIRITGATITDYNTAEPAIGSRFATFPAPSRSRLSQTNRAPAKLGKQAAATQPDLEVTGVCRSLMFIA